MLKRYALITDGVVTNIVEQDTVPPTDFSPVESAIAKIGDTYDGASFISAPIPAQPELTYAQKRQGEYPPMADYLDAVVKGDAVALQAYVDACSAVKAKYPKPII